MGFPLKMGFPTKMGCPLKMGFTVYGKKIRGAESVCFPTFPADCVQRDFIQLSLADCVRELSF